MEVQVGVGGGGGGVGGGGACSRCCQSGGHERAVEAVGYVVLHFSLQVYAACIG